MQNECTPLLTEHAHQLLEQQLETDLGLAGDEFFDIGLRSQQYAEFWKNVAQYLGIRRQGSFEPSAQGREDVLRCREELSEYASDRFEQCVVRNRTSQCIELAG